MRLRESFNFAIRGVVANKMRSVLTMLGIVIGVASVITLVAVGTGSQAAVDASIARLGSNTLFVLPNPPGVGGRGGSFASQIRRALGIKSPPVNATQTHKPALTFEDATALTDVSLAPDVVGVAPGALISQKVSAVVGSSSHAVQNMIGTSPEFLSIDNDTISDGRSFTDTEYTNHSRMCLLGTSVASDLTDLVPGALVGKAVRLNGQPFTVVGILTSKGFSGQQDLDDRVLAPLTAVQDALYGYAPPGQGPLNAIAVEASSPKTTAAAQIEVMTILAERHHESLVNTDFLVFNASSVLAASASTNKTLTILLAAVAGISLLVGGIGVMNIMLVSVTERTREIGIRKAIGADRRDIIGQFLGEAVILSMLGGTIGVLFGFVATRFTIAGVVPVIAPYSVYLAFGVSLFTGLFFGLYPASRAASLRPIDALRYE
jgi:putative ABC transport system permease protein